jgi:hypothetical protein
MADNTGMVPDALRVSKDTPPRFDGWWDDEHTIACYSWPIEVSPGVWSLTTGTLAGLLAAGFVPPPAVRG